MLIVHGNPMNTSTLRSAAALLGAVILSVTLGRQPALAQSAGCPCLTGDQVDELFQKLQLSVDQPGQKVACVDDPGFTTFDYFDRSPPRRSIYIDVTYPTSRTPARCTVDLSHLANNILKESRVEITSAQARACRKEIVKSQVWKGSGCPTTAPTN